MNDNPKRERPTSRYGRHKEGHVLLGAMVEPRKKAIAIVTAAALAGKGRTLTQTDVIWEGIMMIARSVGVVDERGEPTPKYKDAVLLALESVIADNRRNRGSRGGKRDADSIVHATKIAPRVR